MLATSSWTIAAVSTAVVAFAGWLLGLGVLMIVARPDFESRHPRAAKRLDHTVLVSWIASTIVLFGPALGFTIAALSVE